MRPRAIALRDLARARRSRTKPQPKPDDFTQRLIKYIPTEVIGAYVAAMGALDGLIPKKAFGLMPATWIWIVFGFLFVMAFVWTLFSTGSIEAPRWQWFQSIAAPIAFATWAFALGGPFEVTISSYSRPIASVVLILVSLGIPALDLVLDKIVVSRRKRS